MLEQIRRDVIGAADLAAGEMGAGPEVAVCFADLVGFTKLGEQVETEELGLIAGRLDELATAVAEPPVRLVKLIGDAAMLVSTDAAAMVEAALRMVEAADEEGDEFPRLRAGIAHGSVHVQAGDYYGRPVNLASRLTGIAKPGSVLIDRGRPRRRRRPLRLLLRRRETPQGLRPPRQALPRPPPRAPK